MTDAVKYSGRLKGRKVLIFGGSAGLGYGAAEACLENGMAVLIASSSQKNVDNAVDSLLEEYPSAKGRISGYACNLGDQATLEDNIIQLLEKVGTLDHIIHSAGDPLFTVVKPLDQIDVDLAVKSHMVRHFASLMIGKHAKKYLSPGPHSSITFTSGTIVLRPRPDWVLASGVMHALQGLSQALALELAPVRVNVVCPGAVDTGLWGPLGEDAIKEMKDGIAKNMPTQRTAHQEDLAEAYLYTLRDLNLTGSIVKSDSGAALK